MKEVDVLLNGLRNLTPDYFGQWFLLFLVIFAIALLIYKTGEWR